MPFPDTQRIIYRKNPLTEVICQLRFPPILSIESELPARFQGAIRDIYPLFKENIEAPLMFPDELTAQLPNDLIRLLPSLSPSQGTKNYEFKSEDEFWKINLTRTFISMTSYNYKRWEEFLTHFTPAFNSVVEIYSPSFFTRIGLRYKDLFDRSELNLGETPWSELLQPQIAGVLSDPNIYQNVIGTTNLAEIRLNDETSFVRIRHGLVNAKGHENICYLIDSDFFTDHKTSIDQGIDKLNYFNQRGTRLLRWCITDTLHNALEPEQL